MRRHLEQFVLASATERATHARYGAQIDVFENGAGALISIKHEDRSVSACVRDSSVLRLEILDFIARARARLPRQEP